MTFYVTAYVVGTVLKEVDKSNERSGSDGFLLFGLTSGQTSVRGVVLLFLVYFGSLLVAAVLAPPVYFAVQWLAPDSYLAGKSFADYFDRLRWLPVLIGLPLLIRVCGLWSFDRLGLGCQGIDLRLMLRGFVAGVLMLSAVMVPQLLFSPWHWKPESAQAVIMIAGLSLLGAVLVSLLEEIVFRGLALRIFYTATRFVGLAITLSAVFFAYTHFKLPGEVWASFDGEVGWTTGFWVAGWTIAGISVNFDWIPFANLMVLGLILAILFLRSGRLASCIGLHAGLVFVLLSYRRMIDILPFPPEAHDLRWFWGSDKIIDGAWTLVLLVLIVLSVARRFMLARRPAAAGLPVASR